MMTLSPRTKSRIAMLTMAITTAESLTIRLPWKNSKNESVQVGKLSLRHFLHKSTAAAISLDAVKKLCEDVYLNESYYACAVASSGTVYCLVQGSFNF